MAGGMRKLGVYLGLVEDDPDLEAYDEAPAERSGRRSEPATPSREPETLRPVREPARTMVREPASRDSTARAPQPMEVEVAAPTPMDLHYRITTIHPRAYNDARRIGEEFRNGTPVIMNLTEMPDSDAKRIVDFAAGLIFGLAGSIERVTNKVFLLSPANVDVAAEARAQLAQDGFFNQS